MSVLKNIGRAMDALVAAASTFIIIFAAIFVPLLIVDIRSAPHDGQGGIGGFLIALPIALICGVAMFGWAINGWKPLSDDPEKYWRKQTLLAIGAGIISFVVLIYHPILLMRHYLAVPAIGAVVAAGAWLSFAVVRLHEKTD